MGLILNRRREMGGELLPYDAQIQYLQSNGSQWIDTGVKFKGSSKIEISFMGLAQNNLAVFGADNGSAWNTGEIALFWNGSVFEPVIPTSNSASIVPVRPTYATNTLYNVSLDKSSIVFNGTSYSISMYASYVCSRNLFLLATNRGSAIVPSSCKLFYTKIYDNGVLIRDLIPVRVGTAGYLYDKVSKTFFGNSGSGSFTLGPDV